MPIINRIILLISLILFIYAISINIYGQISFSKTLAFISFVFIIYGLVQIKLKDRLLLLLPLFLQKIIYVAFIVVIALFIVIEGIIIITAANNNPVKTDKVIILGAALKGTQITTSLKLRLDTALNYYKFNSATIFIVSGGQGQNEDIPEATAMKNYLIENGVNENQIITEDQSTSTYENIMFSSQYIDENDSVTIITNGFHSFRAKMIARSMNINAITYSAPTQLPSSLNFYIREFFAVIKDFIIIIFM